MATDTFHQIINKCTKFIIWGKKNQNLMKKQNFALTANAVLIILEIIGTAISLSDGGLVNFIWYTVLSNVFAMAVSICYCVQAVKYKKIPEWIASLRFGASVCLLVTFLIVVFVLVPMSLPYGTAAKVLYQGSQIYHHILCPLISVCSFLFLEKSPKKGLHSIIKAALPTFIYAIVLTVLNLLKIVHGPYPFLYVYEQPWYLSVFWFLVIPALALGIAIVLLKITEKMKKSTTFELD